MCATHSGVKGKCRLDGWLARCIKVKIISCHHINQAWQIAENNPYPPCLLQASNPEFWTLCPMENTPIPLNLPRSEMADVQEKAKDASEVMVEDAGVPWIDPVAEKRLVRKQDLLMMPLLWAMFYVAYLVR